MRWWNLKKNKCPKCNKDFITGTTMTNGVLEHNCGFKIRETRYQEILSDMNGQDIGLGKKEWWEDE